MNSRPRISVVIPTHNGAATLAVCLQSLRSNSLPPHEIIVVDDASSDHSSEIAQRFACCVVRLDQNIGAARAKNCGARAATGDLLFFTDDDVVVAPDALERVALDLDETGVEGVVGLLDREIPFHNFASNYKNLWMRFTYSRLPHGCIGVFYTSVAAIRRELFLQLGGFDENYAGASIAEDTEFGQRVWSLGHRVILDPHLSVKHCKHYTPSHVLGTDFLRARALTLMRLRKWGRKFFTSVPLFYQLAVPILFATVSIWIFAALFSHPVLFLVGAFGLVAFYGLNGAWLVYLLREGGPRLAALGALIQPFDALAVGGGMLVAGMDWLRGKQY